MKPTDDQIKKQSSIIATELHGDAPSEGRVHFRVGFIEGAQWAISQMQPEWVPINSFEDLPKEFVEAWFYDKPSQSIVCGTFRPTKDEINFILANASHYMIINRPQPPTK